MPSVQRRVRGSSGSVVISSDSDRKALLEAYEVDKLAATSIAPRASQLATWQRFLDQWYGEHMPMLPVEVDDVAYVGSLMKAAGYRSFSNYVSAVKQEHVKAGYLWSMQHELEAKQGLKSVTRGQGPPRQSAPLIIDDVLALQLSEEALCQAGPVNPKGVFFLGASFLLREIEVAYARLAHLRLDVGRRRASLELPVSKTDPSAVGCSRTWGCTCDGAMPAEDCVYHAAAAHLVVVRKVLGVPTGDPLEQALPLFPDAAGATITKAAMVSTIEALGAAVGESLENSAGQRRFGGHSLRVSGAQWLGTLGFSVDQVKTFGRWASDTVLRYLGETHVSDLARSRRRLIREQGLLDCAPLAAPGPSGPACYTEEEIQRLVQGAVDSAMAEVSQRVDALRVRGGPAYDLLIHERRKMIHRMAVDVAAPVEAWQTQCGWRFATSLGWRLGSMSCHVDRGHFKPCSRCNIPIPGDGV